MMDYNFKENNSAFRLHQSSEQKEKGRNRKQRKGKRKGNMWKEEAENNRKDHINKLELCSSSLDKKDNSGETNHHLYFPHTQN